MSNMFLPSKCALQLQLTLVKDRRRLRWNFLFVLSFPRTRKFRHYSSFSHFIPLFVHADLKDKALWYEPCLWPHLIEVPTVYEPGPAVPASEKTRHYNNTYISTRHTKNEALPSFFCSYLFIHMYARIPHTKESPLSFGKVIIRLLSSRGYKIIESTAGTSVELFQLWNCCCVRFNRLTDPVFSRVQQVHTRVPYIIKIDPLDGSTATRCCNAVRLPALTICDATDERIYGPRCSFTHVSRLSLVLCVSYDKKKVSLLLVFVSSRGISASRQELWWCARAAALPFSSTVLLSFFFL